LRVTFWGVRGSCPTPDPSVLRYGGNTPCIEVRVEGHLLILDAGTGLHNLVSQLAAEDAGPGLVPHLMLTHYHWAHIQGLPFLESFWLAGNAVSIYGPWRQSANAPSLGALLKSLFSAPVFSGDAERAQSAFAVRELAPESDFRIGSAWIRTCPTNHPGGALAYRIDHGECSLVYVPDHEPGDPACDLRLISLARGADLFVCDAQLDPNDSSDPANSRGHGSWQAAVELARRAEVRHLALFHHDPRRSDAEVDAFVAQAQQTFANLVAAGEGLLVDLEPGQARFWVRTGRGSQRARVEATAQVRPVQRETPVEEQVQLKDLSLQGAYFVGSQSYNVNEAVSVLIEFPPEAGAVDPGARAVAPPLRLRGTVTRVEPRRVKGGGVGVGVRFSESPAVDILRLPGKAGTRKAD
jgi:phosphoribosyl 1,2-cyclic phosphodiesterase